jgi:hypothetical protein
MDWDGRMKPLAFVPGHSLFALLGLVSLASSASAAVYDLTANSSVSVDTIYGTAIFQTDATKPAGSGFLDNMGDVFLTIHDKGVEEGYNTNAQPAPFDVQRDGNRFNNGLKLSDLTVVTGNGGQTYFAFLIDINEPNSTSTSMISLDSLKIYTSEVANQSTTNVDSLGEKRFDLDLPQDSYIKYNDLNSGSGEGDIMFFIPTTAFFQDGYLGQSAASMDDYIYLYAKFGTNIAANSTLTQGGYEEFWTAKDVAAVPEPSAIIPLIGVLGAAIGMHRHRPSRSRGSVEA